MIRYFRYQGSKEHILNTLNRLVISNNKYKIYIEPFLGAGTVFLNIPDIFDVYKINDLDKNVITIWHAIENHSYQDFLDAHSFILDRFGDIKEDKDAYYKFRYYYNEEYHEQRKQDSGLFLYFLANSCINSMLRFGPNGMNQSWGNRLFMLSEIEFVAIRNKLKKTVITNKDYKSVIRGISNALIYLDPPYYKRHTSYSENFKEEHLVELINIISWLNDKNHILYSDIETDISNSLLNANFTKIPAKEMRNISPLRSSEFIDEREVLYHNIESRFFK